ncbi:MAG: GMC family oxidoreductase N-terminal domain-containing protein, partial [Actinomycetia bacterium]|nr:GMC family oxidoreductase N-terminal domain-containing protein [Actinomycetes bacterium]
MDADYVIVGTGSAGAVVANLLSADPAAQVVVLEAGARDKNKFVHIPAAFPQLMRGPLDWDYLTEPQPGLGGRRIYWPRGKMLGGSSSMNAMMWVRGFAADYDEWGEHAGAEWNYAHVEPYLRRIEAGPLVISRQRSPRPSTADWLTAVQECGHRVEGPNQDEPQGFCETLVTQRRGARWSAADAYLKPIRRRTNLTVLTQATATRVVFAGDRAIGVEFDGKGGRAVATARREVVLCAGAVNTPQLLMLSGVGDRHQLARHGIPSVAHTPEVGANLLDHLVIPLGFDVPYDSLADAQRPLELLKYLLRRRGMLTSNVGEAYGFVKSRPDLDLPDLELIFAPAPYFDEGIGDP